MANLSVQSKEQLIIGTILSCNNEIKKFSKLTGLKESTKFNMYHFNMVQLFGDINPLFENDFQINKIPEDSIFVKNTRGNYYSYFQKVNEFLEGYEPNIQQSLNESLIVDDIKVKNPIQMNIDTFKIDLKNIINDLEKQNDLNSVSNEIIKIKTFAKRPIFIHGFDICNNIALQKELIEKFNLSINKLISICFDKSKKQLLFITDVSTNIICYDLNEDILDLYNNINIEDKIKQEKLNIKTYLFQIKELIHNNIIELYFNIDLLDLKYSDNLYSDISRKTYSETIQKQKSLIK